MTKKEIYLLIALFFVTAFLRFSQLGYSHFYGDETKTLYLDKTVSAVNFFLNQRKGPVQFLIVWGVEKLTGGFNELNVRLPFALAGFISVFVFYYLVKKFIGPREAAFAVFLFALSGFNIAFSRTAQYQSVLILFGLLAVLCAYKFTVMTLHKTEWLMLTSVFLALAFLTHYDAIFFAVPVMAILVAYAKHNAVTRAYLLKSALLFLIPILTVLTIFYLPYVGSGNFEQNTSNYLARRINGESYQPSNSLYTAKVYNPYLVGFIPLFFAFFFFAKGFDWKKLVLFLWFVIPFIVFEFVFLNPGTHINNYYMPLYILAAIGFTCVLDQIKGLKAKQLLASSVVAVFLIYLIIDISVYVPALNTGYPWGSGSVNKNYHLYLYGFPYYRGWDQVRDYLYSKSGVRNFYTNDNASVAAYYLYKYDVSPPGSNFEPQYYILVVNSQEFKYPDPAFLNDYELDHEIYDHNTLLSQIYHLKVMTQN
jgi:4-amino-4-deoxy-L-arabinose transferase-like glycosyltransferase